MNHNESDASHASSLLNMARDKAASCVQCGYCLSSCPTYQVTKHETQSPRGRIHLVKMAAEGRLPLEALVEPLDLCLGCRACETACPSGVEYGQIYHAAMHAISANQPESPLARLLRRWFLRRIVPHPDRLRLFGHSLWAYQQAGLRDLVRMTNMLEMFPGNLEQWEQILPEIPPPHQRRLPQHLPPKNLQGGKTHHRPVKVGFFHGCIMETLFHRVNRLGMELLAACGYEVLLIAGQTCCGALHAHAGEDEPAIQLAQQNITAAESAGVDWIVSTAGGCGAHLHEYPALFAHDRHWQERAQAFSDKVRDISQLLWDADRRPDAKPMPVTVTYQPSCHMTHVHKITDAPRKLLQSIPKIRFQEIPRSELCCGSAGIYNLFHFDMAMDIVALKTEGIRDMQAAYVVTSNPGCQLQMQLGILQAGLKSSVRVVHLVEFLAEAWEIEVHAEI